MPRTSQSPNPLRRLASSLHDLRERHRDRHRPTGFGFAFADRVDFLDPERWDAMAGGTLFLRRALLRVIEADGPPNVHPRYAMIFRDDKPVAILAAQVVAVTGDRLNREGPAVKAGRSSPLLKRVLAPAARVATSNVRERILVAGNSLS
jgi:hypothetical protein